MQFGAVQQPFFLYNRIFLGNYHALGVCRSVEVDLSGTRKRVKSTKSVPYPTPSGPQGHRDTEGEKNSLGPLPGNSNSCLLDCPCCIALTVSSAAHPPSSFGAPASHETLGAFTTKRFSPMEDSQSQVPLLPPQIPADIVSQLKPS